MRKHFKISLLIFSLIGLAVLLSSYDNKTMHPALNELAYDRFIKALASKKEFSKYNISTRNTIKGKAVTARGWKNITEDDAEFTVKKWIIHGAFSADEPELLQSLRHFYDPVAIDNGAHYLTDAIPPGVTNPKIDLISWALEYEGEISNALSGFDGLEQKYSWRDGQKSIVFAMKEADPEMQNRYMAHAWRSLGESLHALADMVCPVHVRNDGHPVSDPYEDAIRGTRYVRKIPAEFWDKGLIDAVKSTKEVADIYKMVAKNTNENFFTTQTIYGNGVKKIKPAIRSTNPYPLPYAKESGGGWDYDPSDFTYYKLINGHKIKMCKDRYYFADAMKSNFRTDKAYIDLDVAKSQAYILLSNFLGVAPEVMMRYLPVIKIEVDKITEDSKNISGIVDVTSGNGYHEKTKYESSVNIMNLTTKESAETKAFQDGKFSTSDITFSEGDQIQVFISLGGLIVRSDLITVKEGEELNTEGIEGIVDIDEKQPADKTWVLIETKIDNKAERVARKNKSYTNVYNFEQTHTRNSNYSKQTFIGNTDTYYNPPKTKGESLAAQFDWTDPPQSIKPGDKITIQLNGKVVSENLSFFGFGFQMAAGCCTRQKGADDANWCESLRNAEGKSSQACNKKNRSFSEKVSVDKIPKGDKDEILIINVSGGIEGARTEYIYEWK